MKLPFSTDYLVHLILFLQIHDFEKLVSVNEDEDDGEFIWIDIV